MGIFGGGGEVIDYTLLQKKGLLKLPKQKEPEIKFKSEGGFVDFTAFRNEPSQAPAQTPAATASPSPNFDFLSNMATAGLGASETSVSPSPLATFDTFTPAVSTSTSELSGSIDAREMNALKIKIDDLDYKINNFIEKLDKIEERLNRVSLG